MNKSKLKKNLRLQLSRETLHLLEQSELKGIVGGITLAASCQNCSGKSQLTCCSRLC